MDSSKIHCVDFFFEKLQIFWQECCRKGNAFQGPRVGFCLTLGNELSEETHILTKQETAGKEGCLVGSSRARGPGELLCQVAHSLRFYGDGVSFLVVSCLSF